MYRPRLKNKFETEIIKSMIDRFSYKTHMQVPRLLKICINQGLGKSLNDKKIIDKAINELTLISGQKAVSTLSKKDISNFKLRKGAPIGVRVTLRKNQMYEFLERFIYIASPRIRDFRGLSSNGFDGHGNYNFGITEQIIFPEIDYDKVDKIRGMDITITTSAKNDKEGEILLRAMLFPFKD